MRRSWAMRSFIPPLTMSFRWMMPSSRPPSATASGVPPLPRDPVAHLLEVAGNLAAALTDELADRFGRALAELPALEIHAAHSRVGGERNEVRLVLRNVAASQAVLLFCQNHDRSAFRRLVREAGQLRRIGQFLLA